MFMMDYRIIQRNDLIEHASWGDRVIRMQLEYRPFYRMRQVQKSESLRD